MSRSFLASSSVVLGVALSVACGGDPAPSSRSPPRGTPGTPVVLISVDTLRSDRLPIYGYEAIETPALEALRRDSVLFERAYAHVPLTLPSHASLLTGQLPTEHRVRDNAGYRLDSEGLTLLPELLREHGYATGGAVSSFVLRSSTGMATGFDFYDDAMESKTADGGGLERRGEETLEALRPWLRRVAAEPFFLFFHLYEPHTPYSPPEPFASRYGMTYDAEVAVADRVIGAFLDQLRDLEVYERAIVVLVSDHGEGLGDHGEEEHGVFLYREALQVPLLVKLPRSRGGGTSIPVPAQLIDVAPTVLALLEIPVPEELRGRPLLEPARVGAASIARESSADPTPRPIFTETLYPRLHLGWSDLRSVIEGPFHYIQAPQPELYDLLRDPGETQNLLHQNPRLSRALAQTLEGYEPSLNSPGEEDHETRKRLEALGYLAASAAPGAPESLPDPKTRLQELRDLEAALGHMARREYEAAAHAFRRLLAQSPDMVDAWKQLARALERTGRIAEALEAYEGALRLSGGAPEVALATAPLFLRRGRIEEARVHALLAAETFPAEAHDLLARIALSQGDLVEAEVEARRGVEVRGSALAPWVTLGEVLLEQGRLEEVLELTREVEGEFAARVPPDPTLLLLQSRTLRHLGRRAEAQGSLAGAEDLARKLLTERPQLAAAHSTLGRILLEQGEIDDALVAFQGAKRWANPDDAQRFNLGLDLATALAGGGRSAEALRILEPLVADDDPQALYTMAMVLSDTGQSRDAIPLLERLLGVDGENARAYESLGLVHLRLENYDEARNHLGHALRLDPRLATAWNLLGVVLLRGSHDGPGALEAWERALEIEPRQYDVLFNLGAVAADLGKLDVAREALERFSREAPPERYSIDIEKARLRLSNLGG